MKKRFLLLILVAICISQMSWASDPVDVTSTYLQNYQKPFTGKNPIVYLKSGNTRWQEVGTPWVVEGGVGTEGSDYTSWELDNNKGNAICITPTWDGFASNLKNQKVYQTTDLPAGKYLLEVSFGEFYGCPETYLVINNGVGIPDIENIGTSLSSAKYSTGSGISCFFTLIQSAQVSLGVVSNPGNSSAIMINSFKLQTMDGPYYGVFNTLFNKAIDMAAFIAGDAVGTFPQAAQDEFMGTLIEVSDWFDANQNTATQVDVDAKVQILTDAIEKYTQSVITPSISSDLTSFWYSFQVPAGRPTADKTYLMSSGGAGQELTYQELSDPIPNSQLWKLVPNGEAGGFALVNKETGEYINTDQDGGALVTQPNMPTNPLIFSLSNSTVNGICTFLFENIEGSSPDFRLHAGGSEILNWTGDATDHCGWLLVKKEEPNAVNTPSSNSKFTIKVKDRMIKVEGTNSPVSVFTISGISVDANKELKSGVYIVKIGNEVAKIFVR